MIRPVYTTDGLRPGERLTSFDQFQVNSEHPMHVTSEDSERFTAHARALDLAGVDIVELTCSPARVMRTPRLVRECDPRLISVVLPMSGRLVLTQAGRQAILQAGDLGLYSSSRPFEIHIDSDTDTARLVRMQLPRSLVGSSFSNLERALATPLTGNQGVGALLRQFLTQVATDQFDYAVTDLPRLGNVAVDLLTAILVHEFGTPNPTDSQPHSMLPRIMAYVRQHLHDPRLSPRSIAAAHHISVSYLHRLFQDHDTTVWAWIRQQRLERARRDLTDPELMTMPVHRIAARWGFSDHATFTRAFRASYGIPPRDYRQSPAANPMRTRRATGHADHTVRRPTEHSPDQAISTLEAEAPV